MVMAIPSTPSANSPRLPKAPWAAFSERPVALVERSRFSRCSREMVAGSAWRA